MENEQAGRQVGSYRLQEMLGEGPLGEVYTAQDELRNRTVALRLLPQQELSGDGLHRLSQELNRAVQIRHPGVAQLLETGTHEGVRFLVYEYAKGKTLDRALAAGAFPIEDALIMALQIAEALATVHKAGCAHGMINLSNIVLTPAAGAKVLDLGLSTLAQEKEVVWSRLGAAVYAAPEQLETGVASPESDIFSFGTVLYELLTGKPAFPREGDASNEDALKQEPKPISELAPELPLGLVKTVNLCLKKEPDRRPSSMAAVRLALEDEREHFAYRRLVRKSVPRELNEPLRRLPSGVLIGAALFAAVSALIYFYLTRPKPPPPPPPALKTRQLTRDAALTFQPAFSPDGTKVVYSSDRAGEGQLDLWIQNAGSGEPSRLTKGLGDCLFPTFSPDGAYVVFVAQSDEGWVSMVPSVGGEVRKIVPGDSHPAMSSDGRRIAFLRLVPPSRLGVFLTDTAGRDVNKVETQVTPAGRSILWSEDGKSILFHGWLDETGTRPPDDWWVLKLADGRVVRTMAWESLTKAGIQATDSGLWRADTLHFLGSLGGQAGLCSIELPGGGGRAKGMPSILATTPDVMVGFSASRDATKFAFAQPTDVRSSIWSLPVDAGRGEVRGNPTQETPGGQLDLHPSVSADARRLAYSSRRAGKWGIWSKTLPSGGEALVQETADLEPLPILSPDGRTVVYTVSAGEGWEIYLRPVAGGAPRRLTATCGVAVSWQPGGKQVLCERAGNRRQIAALHTETGECRTVAEHASSELIGARFSPDGKWFLFSMQADARRRKFFAGRWREGTPLRMEEWIPVDEGQNYELDAAWGPDGDLLFYISDRDGFQCLWGQPIDALTKRAGGTPFALLHFHNPRFNLGSRLTAQYQSSLVVTSDRFFFPRFEPKANVWIAEAPGER